MEWSRSRTRKVEPTWNPNNRELVLRTLAGFIVHPNVAAALIVDSPDGPVTNRMLRRYLEHHEYPTAGLIHEFHTLERDVGRELESCGATLRQWLPEVNRFKRSPQPRSHLNVALQCGGSDAFSGVSANPLASWVSREIIRCGGAANHAETDELIGAEPYMLLKVRSLEVAQEFLARIEHFKEMTSWHGATAEGNPSGGNKLRGLYNISLKSIGAAMKRHPDVRLDEVIEYSQRIPGSGFYFMNSPGNDLESVAGQVASGANLIFFTTGNGSVTNFPFVPTIKMVTTTPRYQMLSDEMDVNAGEYLDGVPMAELGRRTFELTCSVASGELTKGEKAGHYQVSIWRDWRQSDSSALQVLQSAPLPGGEPLMVRSRHSSHSLRFRAINTPRGPAADQVGLVLPTSLCSGQVSLLIARQLNREMEGGPLSRIVALPHTEGCGYLSGGPRDLFVDTLVSYLTHPLVGAALLLEHGCDKIHNGVIRSRLLEDGIDPARFGAASVQLDGGLEQVTEKVVGWFRSRTAQAGEVSRQDARVGDLTIGIVSSRPIGEEAGTTLSALMRRLVDEGTTPDPAPGRSAARSSPGERVLEIKAQPDSWLRDRGGTTRPSCDGQSGAAPDGGAHRNGGLRMQSHGGLRGWSAAGRSSAGSGFESQRRAPGSGKFRRRSGSGAGRRPGGLGRTNRTIDGSSHLRGICGAIDSDRPHRCPVHARPPRILLLRLPGLRSPNGICRPSGADCVCPPLSVGLRPRLFPSGRFAAFETSPRRGPRPSHGYSLPAAPRPSKQAPGGARGRATAILFRPLCGLRNEPSEGAKDNSRGREASVPDSDNPRSPRRGRQTYHGR